jgi:tetraacyldisaccharide 4'-kinase
MTAQRTPAGETPNGQKTVRFSDRLVAAWYAPRLTPLTAALLPLSLLFRAAVAIRRWAYRAGIGRGASLPVPVIVLGSILIGGVGKTPLTRALAAALARAGWRPGIVSRGYGGSNAAPRAVAPGDDPAEVGDEPLLLAADALPVWIGRDRVAAARALLAAHPDCDVILADDARLRQRSHASRRPAARAAFAPRSRRCTGAAGDRGSAAARE